jgi:hypothetical protein
MSPVKANCVNVRRRHRETDPDRESAREVRVSVRVSNRPKTGTAGEKYVILLGNLVSPEGIEPSTNRLRVCCSAN